MSESRCALRSSAPFRTKISSFGASDLEINMAAENDYTIALRRALAEQPALRATCSAAARPLPMVFQYDPLDYFSRPPTNG